MSRQYLRQWVIDAFADAPFGGNPAAVVPIESWLPDATMLAIAGENNLSETAFFVRTGAGRYHLRWFTPSVEVPLCGHATLASAHVVFSHLEPALGTVTFDTLSGPLTIARDGDLLAMDLPAQPARPRPDPALAADLSSVFGNAPHELLDANYLLAVMADEAAVSAIKPSALPPVLARHGETGVIVTARTAGKAYAIASRFFVPGKGILEDPVTGAAHAALVPFWAPRLGADRFVARQISRRGGTLDCTLAGDRVILKGRCSPFLEGVISI